MFLCVSVVYCSIYVVIFIIFLAADVSVLTTRAFCSAHQFNVRHCLHLYDYLEQINDDDDTCA